MSRSIDEHMPKAERQASASRMTRAEPAAAVEQSASLTGSLGWAEPGPRRESSRAVAQGREFGRRSGTKRRASTGELARAAQAAPAAIGKAQGLITKLHRSELADRLAMDLRILAEEMRAVEARTHRGPLGAVSHFDRIVRRQVVVVHLDHRHPLLGLPVPAARADKRKYRIFNSLWAYKIKLNSDLTFNKLNPRWCLPSSVECVTHELSARDSICQGHVS